MMILGSNILRDNRYANNHLSGFIQYQQS